MVDYKNLCNTCSYVYISIFGITGIIYSILAIPLNYLFTPDATIIKKVIAAIIAAPTTGILYFGSIALFTDLFIITSLSIYLLFKIFKYRNGIYIKTMFISAGITIAFIMFLILKNGQFVKQFITPGFSLYSPFSDGGESFTLIFNLLLSIFTFGIPILITFIMDMLNIQFCIQNIKLKNFLFVGFSYSSFYILILLILVGLMLIH